MTVRKDPQQRGKDETFPTKSAAEYCEEGDLHRRKRQWTRALEAYTRAIDCNKDDFRIYERRARVAFELGNYDQVIADLTKAIDLKPDRYLLYDLRGTTSSLLGDRDGVLADFHKALALHPRHNVYLHRALALYNLEEYEQALADLSTAIDVKADYAYAYFRRGMLYEKMGEREKAIADLRRVLELETDRRWSTRAEAYLQEWGAPQES